MCTMRQVVWDRANDGGGQMLHGLKNILQTPSARFVASWRRFCCPSKRWCGRRDLNPHGRLSPADFHAVYGFRRPDVAFGGLTPGLRSGLSLHPPPEIRSLGAARLVSTPSRMEYMAGLGSGLPFEVSPNLSSSAPPVSQASTQVFLKSAAHAIPPRPRAAVFRMIGHVTRFYTSVSSSRRCGEA